MKHVIIVGLMGTGKTTVGEKLARCLQFPWKDTDHELQKMTQMDIPEYFRQYGESSFRKQENLVLQKILDNSPSVITTGGGIVLREDNRRLLLDKGWVVALTAKPETIVQRLQFDRSRPLLAGDLATKVHSLTTERKGLYDFAHYTVPTDNLSITEVVDTIAQHWKDDHD